MIRSKATPTEPAWLGDLPDGWSAPRLRRFATIRNGCDHKHAQVDEGGYPVYGSGGQFARCSDYLHPGPSVLLGRKGTIDNPQLVTEAFWTVDTSFYTEIAPDIDARFFHYVCKTIPYDYFEAGTALPSMTQTNLYSVRCPFPPLSAQRSIADHLDTETSRIDSLIDRKQRFIELLLEKRTALITHAVTKGLDPDVEMKDSGHVELGVIPVHWRVMRVRHLFRNLDGRRIPLSAEDRSYRQGEYDYYGASGVIDHIDDYIFDEPLVLIGEDGANLLLRSTPLAFVANGKYWVNNHAHILRPLCGSPHYWAAALNVIDYTPLIVGSAQPKLTQADLADVPLPVPPPEEITAICEYIEQETTTMDELASKTRLSVDLLREYRTALISAAVTGQIEIPATDTGEDVA